MGFTGFGDSRGGGNGINMGGSNMASGNPSAVNHDGGRNANGINMGGGRGAGEGNMGNNAKVDSSKLSAGASNTNGSMASSMSSASKPAADVMDSTRGTYATAARNAVSTPAAGYSPGGMIGNLTASVNSARNTAIGGDKDSYGYAAGNLGTATSRDNAQAANTASYDSGFNKGYKQQVNRDTVGGLLGVVGDVTGSKVVSGAGYALGALQTSPTSDNESEQAGLEAGRTAASDASYGNVIGGASMLATALGGPLAGALVGGLGHVGSYIANVATGKISVDPAEQARFSGYARDNGQQANGGITGMYEALAAKQPVAAPVAPGVVDSLASAVAASRKPFEFASNYDTQRNDSLRNLNLGSII